MPAESSLPPLLRMSPVRAVWTVAWPMVAVGLLKTSYHLTDAWFIGKLGDAALSAVGGATFAWWMILIACELASVGTQTLVARHLGANRADRVSATVMQGLWVGGLIAVGITALWPLRWLYFEALGFHAGTEAYDLGMAFLGATLLGTVAYAAHSVVDAAFRGLGDTRTSLVIMVLTVVVNAALDPLLIWGLGPIPGFGIAGAAWATTFARALGAVLGAILLARRGHALVLAPMVRGVMRQIGRIGLPVSARGIAFSLVYVALGRFITAFGPEQMAALGLGHRFEGLAFMVCAGFEVGAAALVGQHLGARDPQGALRVTNLAARLCAAVVVPMGVVLFVIAEPLHAAFADQPETIAAGVLYLRVQTLVFAFMAFESVYEGGFSGSGDTVPSFWIGTIGTLVRLPLAWLLAWPLGLGILGVWIAIALSTLGKGLMMWAWFQQMRWVDALRDDPEPEGIPAPATAPADPGA